MARRSTAGRSPVRRRTGPGARPHVAATYAAYDNVDRFKAMLKSGKRSNGEAIKVMPFPSLAALNDIDVEALYAYLRTLPKAGARP